MEGPFFLTRLIGFGRAMEMFLTWQGTLSAEEALKIWTCK